MKDPFLLHMFNPTKNVSPFDVNMAYEAEFDAVIPYADVGLDDIHALTQDTIFSRGPKGVKRTGIFIGGRDFGQGIDMLHRAKAAMVPPFEVSVFVDPSGAITTAAAIVACIEHWLGKQGHGGLEGKNMQILGGTGPVGVCAGILAADSGAEVYLVSRRGTAVGQEIADEYNKRFEVNMHGGDSGGQGAVEALMQDADVVIGAAKAGTRVLSAEQIAHSPKLKVAADTNAVPPLGIEGVEVNDMGKAIGNSPFNAVGIGALAVGNVKYKVHYGLFQQMIKADKPIYLDHNSAFEMAREIVAK